MRISIFAQRRVVCFPVTAASECECRVSVTYVSEREHHVWYILYCFQFLFADGKLSIFVGGQQFAWLAGVVANTLQAEFVQCLSES